ncbi:hypothetical protein [Nocardiopsis dassonvillei]|uniref:hypothetical protein n=1 Tax=Nocardiopsis dassonvillei TaxID=2014 RepID=UPI0012FD3741|nr:hypothetical protein [Nocardiopsis dassonvillei]
MSSTRHGFLAAVTHDLQVFAGVGPWRGLVIMGSCSVSPSGSFFMEGSPWVDEAAVLADAKAGALLSDIVDPRASAAGDLIVDSVDKLSIILSKGYS